MDPLDPENAKAKMEVDKLLEQDMKQQFEIQHRSYRDIVNSFNEQLEEGKKEAKYIIKEQQLILQNYVTEINNKNKGLELLKIHLVNSRRQMLQMEQTLAIFKKRIVELMREKGESNDKVEQLIKNSVNDLLA